MAVMKTPGVYIVEKNAFPNSVVEVATAVPAFVGYTQQATNKGRSLRNQPWRITSLAEFHDYFGMGPHPTFTIAEASAAPATPAEKPTFAFGGKDYVLTQEQGKYLLYYSMVLFYKNGGGPCYVVSVGDYNSDIEVDRLQQGLDQLIKEQEPTMVVMPDAMLLSQPDSITIQQAALAHCGEKMKNRFAILDIWEGYVDRQDPGGDRVELFRDSLGVNHLDYAAAYYPWLNTTIVQDRDLRYENLANQDVLQGLLTTELDLVQPPLADKVKAQRAAEIAKITVAEPDSLKRSLLDKTLRTISPLYMAILKNIKDQLNLLPPSASMAGVYTMVDNDRGVWKAPANVSLNAVVSPAVNITHDDQEDLNVTPQGKSINAIRPFIGEGVLVWGVRTLDGNSLDWRYIQVRRTMIMLEESIRLAAKAYVFEPNDANTWVTMKSMIRNFLTGIWKRGGLAGASPDEAFSVHVGLGETMTPEDILEGILRLTVLVAITRPAEFIEITFQQQMQQS